MEWLIELRVVIRYYGHCHILLNGSKHCTHTVLAICPHYPSLYALVLATSLPYLPKLPSYSVHYKDTYRNYHMPLTVSKRTRKHVIISITWLYSNRESAKSYEWVFRVVYLVPMSMYAHCPGGGTQLDGHHYVYLDAACTVQESGPGTLCMLYVMRVGRQSTKTRPHRACFDSKHALFELMQASH